MQKKMIDLNSKQAEIDYMDVSDEEIRRLIINYISGHDIFYPSDICL